MFDRGLDNLEEHLRFLVANEDADLPFWEWWQQGFGIEDDPPFEMDKLDRRPTVGYRYDADEIHLQICDGEVLCT